MKNEIIKLSRSMNAASSAIQTNIIPMAKDKEQLRLLFEVCGILDDSARKIFERAQSLPVMQEETEEIPT